MSDDEPRVGGDLGDEDKDMEQSELLDINFG
jgi:hypothetical protein